MIEAQQLEHIIEAALFAAQKPLSVKELTSLFDESDCPSPGEIQDAIKRIEKVYETRGIHVFKLNGSYSFRVNIDLGPWVSKLWDEKPARYSRAFLETLAIIAYRQPVTRGEIESIRGVAVSSHITKTLEERGWIRVVGHKDVPGKPALLATTKEFLNYFNLASLEDLPPLTEIKDLDEMAAQLEFTAQQEEALLEEDEHSAVVITAKQNDSEEEPEQASL